MSHQRLCFSVDGSTMTTQTLTYSRSSWVSSFEVAASGFGISTGTPLFPSSTPCRQEETERLQLASCPHRIQWCHPPISHIKLELSVHRPGPLPINTSEHSLLKANISKWILANVKLSLLPKSLTELSLIQEKKKDSDTYKKASAHLCSP